MRIINYFCCLSYDRSLSSYKANSPQCDLVLPLPVSSILFFSVKSNCSCLCLLPQLAVNFILPYIFPSITCFRRQFLLKMWPIQLALFLLIACRIFFFWFTVCNTSSFSDDRSKWSSSSFTRNTLRNFIGISDLLSEVSNFQHHTKLSPKYSILLVSSLNSSPIHWRKERSSCLIPLWPRQSWIKFHVYILHHPTSF